jgi:uncharacterized protein (DUF1800 family)
MQIEKLLQVRLALRGRSGADRTAVSRVASASASERQLHEVLTDFWHNHFSVFGNKMPSPSALADYDSLVIRPHALGRFRELLGAVARSPAMLFYLDNHLSSADTARMTVPEFATFTSTGVRPRAVRKAGLNENYARELLELHTLGVDGGYTQQDVIEVARAFTGWTIETPTSSGAFVFDDERHDSESKSVLGHTIAAGRGIEDGERVLDIVARHPATARFIAAKLATRLVSDSPSEALIQRAAATFTDTDGDIAQVVRTIITSDEFSDEANFRAKVKSPYEFVLSMRRALDLNMDASTGSAQLMIQMNQPLWGKETPDGWPESGSEWMNSGALFNRLNLASRVAHGDVPAMSPDSSATWRALYEKEFPEQLDAVVQHVFGGRVGSGTLEALRSIGTAQATGGQRDASTGRERMMQLLEMAFSVPEFQRR